MADVDDAGYLSIGEVLGLLLEEFPDVTISKIRFLESQGLISPERTSSGYRKFYQDDVELLRVILTEQRTNYLPLRVIKNRLATGEIDPTGEHLRPHGDGDGKAEVADDGHEAASTSPPVPNSNAAPGDDSADDPPAEVPAASIRSHPASRHQPPSEDPPAPDPQATAPVAPDASESDAASSAVLAQLLPGVLLDRNELCGMTGMSDAELTELESFGIVAASNQSGTALYGDDAVEICKTSCEFMRAGVDARHLRNWRTSAEREASLYEQLVTPRFRQRNPEARAAALSELRRLDELGSKLRAAMTRQALRHHFES
jgi:DNA-binding transcriptional MerR regulator